MSGSKGGRCSGWDGKGSSWRRRSMTDRLGPPRDAQAGSRSATRRRPARSHHFRALLDDGREVRFVDPRTFGFVAVVNSDEMEARVCPVSGPTPGTPRRRSKTWQPLLLAGPPRSRRFYSTRSLSPVWGTSTPTRLCTWRASIPFARGSLSEDELKRLLEATRAVLGDAIDNGGTSLEDMTYLLPGWEGGEGLRAARVYGRTDLPCPNCGTPVQRIVIRARSSHFLPRLPAGETLTKAVHAYVSGQVQQVGYRQSCRQMARRWVSSAG